MRQHDDIEQMKAERLAKLDELTKAVEEFLDRLEFGKCKSYLKVSRKAYDRLMQEVGRITGRKMAL